MTNLPYAGHIKLMSFKRTELINPLLFLIVFFSVFSVHASEKSTVWTGNLQALINNGGVKQELKSWSLAELRKFKQLTSREMDPVSGKIVRWRGVGLSQVLDNALSTLPIERRAQIDLVIIENDQGGRALVPRAFIVKYPVILALKKEKETISSGLYSVVPWTSKSRTLNEGLPLESFFISKITRVEFANYRELFADIFLKRRTDPAAIRGEKTFIQNCAVCHASDKAPQLKELVKKHKNKALATIDHPPIEGVPKLSEKKFRYLSNYFNAFGIETSN